jgi:dihydroorotase
MTAVHRFQERSSLVIRGGDVLDPSGRRSADVLVVGNEIVEVAESIEAPSGAVEVDATDAVIASGLVDLHTHLREPGNEDAETIETGSRGAALGGYTAVLAMPNTTPCIDSASMVREILYLGRDASCTVQPVGAITVGRGGKRLSAMGDMAALGVTMFTDDGNGVASSGIMRRALEYATGLGVTLAQHCEDPSLAAGGVMHEGAWSSRLGVPGQPAIAEEIMVQRDLALARLTGARLHFQHLSTAGSVELVRAAKSAGLAVTAEVTTHHLLLTDAACASYDATFRVNPPLRSNDDVAALRAGLADGTMRPTPLKRRNVHSTRHPPACSA